MSEEFGRTKTITIVDTLDGEVKDTRVFQNPATSYKFGAGPILVKTLADMNVDIIIAGEFGPGASALIEDRKIVKVTVRPGTPVNEAIELLDLKLTE